MAFDRRRNLFICVRVTGSVSMNSTQVTASEHGGVVREPIIQSAQKPVTSNTLSLCLSLHFLTYLCTCKTCLYPSRRVTSVVQTWPAIGPSCQRAEPRPCCALCCAIRDCYARWSGTWSRARTNRRHAARPPPYWRTVDCDGWCASPSDSAYRSPHARSRDCSCRPSESAVQPVRIRRAVNRQRCTAAWCRVQCRWHSSWRCSRECWAKLSESNAIWHFDNIV